MARGTCWVGYEQKGFKRKEKAVYTALKTLDIETLVKYTEDED